MAALPPMLFTWTGEEMKPALPKRADQVYVVGERYLLVEQQDRSQRSHNHYFAAVHEGWLSLPEHLAERFPTSEHLRKYALIKAGYSDSHTLVCSSKAEALRIAAFIRPADEFAIVTVSEATVSRFVAKSQSQRAMGAREFQASKTAVLEIIAAMIDTTPAALAANAGKAA